MTEMGVWFEDEGKRFVLNYMSLWKKSLTSVFHGEQKTKEQSIERGVEVRGLWHKKAKLLNQKKEERPTSIVCPLSWIKVYRSVSVSWMTQ